MSIFKRTSFWILVAVMALMVTTAQAQTDKILFVTDRTTSGNLDVGKMRPDGNPNNQEEVTNETGDARHPSVSHSGDHVLYDHGGDLFLVDADGSNVDNLTAVSSGPCSGADLCKDPDAAATRINVDNDFRIVFTRTYVDTAQAGDPTITEIWMVTVDISAGSLSDFYQITDIQGAALAQLHPAWCGTDHVVWDRSSPNESGYEREICVVEVDSTGPVGSETCFFGEQTDNLDDEYPDCSPDATKITWTRGTSYGVSDIFVMDCVDGPDAGDDQFDDCDTANIDNLTYSSSDDDIHSTFDLGGNYIVWAVDDGTNDTEIWVMTDEGTHKTQMTDNSDEDIDPNWGPGGM